MTPKKNAYNFPPEYPYGDNDIPEIDLPPATDDVPIVPDEPETSKTEQPD